MRSIDTTDLEQLRNGASYTWGSLIKIHDIGRYSIVEYKPRKIGISDRIQEVGFGCYVDGEKLSTSSNTLEGALILCIAQGSIKETNEARHMAYAAYKVLSLYSD
jgi:hypothetical protein